MSGQMSLNFGGSVQTSAPDKPRHQYVSLGVPISYELVRSKRRTIGLTVLDEGLRITAPHWVSQRAIEEAIDAKHPWITSKLDLVRQRQQKQAQDDSCWRYGGTIPYVGIGIELAQGCGPGHHTTAAKARYEGDPLAPVAGDRLWLPLPEDADTQRLREYTQAWLQTQARAWFAQRLAHFAQQCGLAPKDWRLSNARTRWGSCSSQQRIGLNWRLIHFDLSIIDYVIAHELAHLRHMNHSPAFWKTLGEILPNYQVGHRKLREYSPGDFPRFQGSPSRRAV